MFQKPAPKIFQCCIRTSFWNSQMKNCRNCVTIFSNLLASDLVLAVHFTLHIFVEKSKKMSNFLWETDSVALCSVVICWRSQSFRNSSRSILRVLEPNEAIMRCAKKKDSSAFWFSKEFSTARPRVTTWVHYITT